MAGDWIKVQICTPDKPEVHRIADALNLEPDTVVGKLIRIWCWADQQTIDGNAPSVTKSLLDRITGVTGFADSLLQVHWLEQTEGGFLFPKFDRHNGNTAKTRASVAKRVEKHRKTPTDVKQKCNAETVTSALLEKRREEKSISFSPGEEIQIPDKMNKPEVLEMAERWFRHLELKDKPEKIPPRNSPQEQAWWSQIARLGPDKFLAQAEKAMAEGWVTLREVPEVATKAKPEQSSEWIKALNAARNYPQDYEARQRILGPELFEALKRTGTPRVANANDYELKTLSASFAEHLKDLRNGTPVSN